MELERATGPRVHRRPLAFARAHRRRLAWAVVGCLGVVVGILVTRRLASTSWPLSRGDPGLLVAAGVLVLVAYVLKMHAWQRLFAPAERPRTFALASASGGASLVSFALPARLGDVARVAIVSRSTGSPAGVKEVCLSLAMLGLVDAAALAPLAVAGAILPGHSIGVRLSLVVVAGAGVAAALLVVALPALAGTRRMLKLRLGRWLRPRTISLRQAVGAGVLACAHWVARALALLLLLGALGAGFSIGLALLFVCAGAAAAALPIGPPGGATQAGAGAAVLVASGVGASQAIDIAIAVQVLGVLAAGAIVVYGGLWHAGTWVTARLAA